MVLAQEQTDRSKERNREPINKPMHIWSINLWKRYQEYTMRKDNVFNNVWEKLDSYMQRMNLDHYLITHMNSQRIKDLNVKPETIKLLEESIGSQMLS